METLGSFPPTEPSTSPGLDGVRREATPEQLALLGFPPPGHPIWDERLEAATSERYPGLDLTAWRTELTG